MTPEETRLMVSAISEHGAPAFTVDETVPGITRVSIHSRELVSAKGAAGLLGVSVKTLREYVRENNLTVIQPSGPTGKWFFDKAQFVAEVTALGKPFGGEG